MKLLMISGDRSLLQGKRGAFWYTLEEFSKHWERIDVITPSVSSEFRVPSSEHPFPNVFFHPSPRGLWYQPWWILKKGKELIAQCHHNVMTVHEYPPFYNGIGARWLHAATGILYALEVHHIEWPAISRWVLPWSARSAAAVRVVNGTVKGQLREWGVTEQKIHIIPSLYLDASLLHPDAAIRKEYDLVFCGRIVSNKGLEDVLRAMSALPSIRLLVVGDGPERQKCEREAVRLGIGSRVTFLGWLPTQQDVARAMQSARVMIVHSRAEGGPRVALEAMACGMPVIATHVGVLPEVIQDGVNGLFTDGTVRGLIGVIRTVLNDPALQKRMGQEAQHVIERFERKKLVKEYAEFLKGLAIFSQ